MTFCEKQRFRLLRLRSLEIKKHHFLTGGSEVEKYIHFIWKILLFWCQRFLRNVKILLRSEVIGVSMCWPFDFSIEILGVIFDNFYISFGNKNLNIETNTSKFCLKVHSNGLFWMKNFDLEILANFDKFKSKIAYLYKYAI